MSKGMLGGALSNLSNGVRDVPAYHRAAGLDLFKMPLQKLKLCYHSVRAHTNLVWEAEIYSWS